MKLNTSLTNFCHKSLLRNGAQRHFRARRTRVRPAIGESLEWLSVFWANQEGWFKKLRSQDGSLLRESRLAKRNRLCTCDNQPLEVAKRSFHQSLKVHLRLKANYFTPSNPLPVILLSFARNVMDPPFFLSCDAKGESKVRKIVFVEDKSNTFQECPMQNTSAVGIAKILFTFRQLIRKAC